MLAKWKKVRLFVIEISNDNNRFPECNVDVRLMKLLLRTVNWGRRKWILEKTNYLTEEHKHNLMDVSAKIYG